MKYRIAYDYKAEGNTLTSEFEIDCENIPTRNDSDVIDAVRKDSAKFHRPVGLVTLTVTSITPLE